MTRLLTACLCMLALFSAPAFADDDRLNKAKGVYKMFCAHCHGLDMVNPGTSSFDLRKFPADQKDRFATSVNKGRGDMPAWGDILLPDELELLWFYVVTRGGKEPEPVAKSEAPAETLPERDATLIKPGTLTACLARNGGVMSSWRSHGGVGLDYELVRALADRMDLDLAVEWFESEQEEESTPVREIRAMLAYGVCDVVPGFALYETSLGAFYDTRAALPRWSNRPAHLGREFQVDLEPVAVSAPYARMEMGVVYRNPGFERNIKSIADLDGLRLGVEQGTLAGVVTLRQGTAAMVRDARTFNPGPAFLWKMEQGEFDAALVTIGAYDFHKRQNGISTLTLDDYRHPIGFNLSVAVLERARGLLDRIDPMIEQMIDDGTMAELAGKSLVTYAAPRPPRVLQRLTMRDILTMR